MEGQGQRRSAPRGLSAEAAKAGAGHMDDAEALEAGAGSRLRPADWGAMTRNQRKHWTKAQRKLQRK